MIRQALLHLIAFLIGQEVPLYDREQALKAHRDACARNDSRDKHRTLEALRAATVQELRRATR